MVFIRPSHATHPRRRLTSALYSPSYCGSGYMSYVRSLLSIVNSLHTLFRSFKRPTIFCVFWPIFTLQPSSYTPSAHQSDNNARSSDLFDAPATLRTILEGLLAESPSSEVLARYSPKIRAALFGLLRGLQQKQAPYWDAVARARETRRLSGGPGLHDG